MPMEKRGFCGMVCCNNDSSLVWEVALPHFPRVPAIRRIRIAKTRSRNRIDETLHQDPNKYLLVSARFEGICHGDVTYLTVNSYCSYLTVIGLGFASGDNT